MNGEFMGKAKNMRKYVCAFAILFFVLVASVSMSIKASTGTQTVSNLVIFVKFQDDTRDIYNAKYDSGSYIRKNWQEIKKMYDADVNYDYVLQKDFDNSFKNFISVISEGKVQVNNFFPQEREAGTDAANVVTYTLQNPASSYTQDGQIVGEVINAIQNGTIAINGIDANALCNVQAGTLDNLTIVVQGKAKDAADIIHPHKAQYGGTETLLGLRVFNYIIMPSNSLVTEDASIDMTGQQEQGVIAHEFLHTLGFPDLYRYGDDGVPVGAWDLMGANSPFLQYPLSYLRAEKGWVNLDWITTAGTYTLTAVSEQGGNKVFAMKTPLSDSEYIVLEYRKKSTSIYDFESSIPSSGLLMYRVDTKVENHTNAAGKNYIYVYRPDVTDPEAGKDMKPNSGANTVYDAAIYVSAGETGYGSTDLTKSFTANTLYYSDGRNSGIQISNATLSADEKQLTFTVDFADYAAADLWDSVGSTIGNNIIGTPFLYTDKATGSLYVAYSELTGTSYQVRVRKWNGSAWETVGTDISNAWNPQLVVNSNELYLSYQVKSDEHPVYCKLSGSTWAVIAEYASPYAKNMQFISDAANLYVAYVESTSNGWNKLIIRDLKKGILINDTKVIQEFANPSLCKVGTNFYVAYSDFFGSSGSANARIEAYDTSTKTWTVIHQYSLSSTNIHILKEDNGKIYAFVGKTGENPVVSIFDGAQWIDTIVPQMTQFFEVSLDVIKDEVYVSFVDTVKKQASILRKNGDTFIEYYDNLGTGTMYFTTGTVGNQMYAALKAENTNNVYIKTKSITIAQYGLDVVAPSGYADATIYVDGIPYAATQSGNTFSTTITHSNARTAVMYYYDTNGIPKGMYVWKLTYANGSYTATALSGLQDLLSYHGFSIRVQSPAGIRFKSGIDESVKNTLISTGIDGYKLSEYGTLFMTNANRNSYPFVKLGRKTGGGRSYWTEGSVVNDKIFEIVSGRVRFASVVTNLPSSQYNTDFAFRGYIILENGGERIMVYGPPVFRSVYTVAKQIDARGEFTPGTSGYNYIKSIISSVEGN